MKKVLSILLIVVVSNFGLMSCDSDINEEIFEIQKTDKGDGDIEEEDVVPPN